MPKISVIVPIYNVAKYLPKCLDSIINQTFKDIEIILVCDGPKEDLSICKEYSQKDSRIIIIENVNKMLGGARNAGLSRATGEYIAFIDSDDWIEKKYLEKMLLPMLNDKSIDIVQCGTQLVYEIDADEELIKNDGKYFEINERGKAKVGNNIYGKVNVGAWNKLYKRELIEKYNLRYPLIYNEDAYFVWCYWAICNNIYYLPEKIYFYRRRANSLMTKTLEKVINEHVLDHLTVSEMFFDFLNKNKLFEKFETGFWASYQISWCFVAVNSNEDFLKKGFFKAKKFLKQKDIPEKFDLLKRIQNLSYQQFKIGGFCKMKKIKFLGIPVLTKIKTNNKKKVLLLGFLPVYKKKIKNGKVKRYLCGIKFSTKKNTKQQYTLSSPLDYEKDKLKLLKKGKNPKVSIILPIYNVEEYLEKCISSVLNQTLEDIEVILGTDGPEACDKICEDFAKKDSRVKVIYHPGSYGKACNQGMAIAKGEYIGFVETDDWISPQMFEKLYLWAKKNKADVCKAGFTNTYDDIKLNNDVFFTPDNSLFNIRDCLSLLAFQPSIWSAIYKTDFLRKNNITMIEERMPFIDSPFHMETLLRAKNVVGVAEPLYYYYHGNPNQSVQNEKASFAGLKSEEYFYSHISLTDFDKTMASALFNATLCHLIWDYERLSNVEYQVDFKNKMNDFFDTLPIEQMVDKTLLEKRLLNFFEKIRNN